MTKREIVETIRTGQFDLPNIFPDVDRDDLRQLLIEFDGRLYELAKTEAHMSNRELNAVLAEFYSPIAEVLEQVWTFDGEWVDE